VLFFAALVALLAFVATAFRGPASSSSSGQSRKGFAHLPFHGILIQFTRTTSSGLALLLLHHAAHIHRAWFYNAFAAPTVLIPVAGLALTFLGQFNSTHGLGTGQLLHVHPDGLRLGRFGRRRRCRGRRSGSGWFRFLR